MFTHLAYYDVISERKREQQNEEATESRRRNKT